MIQEPTSAPPVGPNDQRLRRGALGIVDISASTMANIGSAMSFLFGSATVSGFGYNGDNLGKSGIPFIAAHR